MEYLCKTINEKSFQDYSKSFCYSYNLPVFLETLGHHTPLIHYLTIGAKKPKAVLFFAEYEDKIVAPFSAPFWSIEKLKKNYSTDSVFQIITSLSNYLQGFNKEVTITLPPLFYDNDFINKVLSCFLANGYCIKFVDINHYFFLDQIDSKEYVETLAPNARRNLKIAENATLSFKKFIFQDDVENAFTVIVENRKAKGYPLRLTFEQLYKTLLALGGDVFGVNQGNDCLASAFVFNINSSAKQLIYWGDISAAANTKAMNYLAYHLIKYYKEANIKFLDLGPSSDQGYPNIGLCTFKESIGASITIKTTITKKQGK